MILIFELVDLHLTCKVDISSRCIAPELNSGFFTYPKHNHS